MGITACTIYTYPQTKKVASIVFEERMVTHEKWLKSFSWQMTLRLGLSKPPCGVFCSPLWLAVLSSVNYTDE